jgi:hypothetical protein
MSMIRDAKSPLLHLVVIIVSILMFCSCKNDLQVEVGELVKNIKIYNRQVVTVKGCYSKSYEAIILHSCNDPKSEDAIWIEPYTYIENTSKSFSGYEKQFKSLEMRPSEYEERLAAKLVRMSVGTSAKVLMRGEFQCSTVPHFGHEGQYRYLFIVHRVLSVELR